MTKTGITKIIIGLFLLLLLIGVAEAKRPVWTECKSNYLGKTCEEKILPFNEYVRFEEKGKSFNFEWKDSYVKVEPKFRAKSGFLHGIGNWFNGLSNVDLEIEEIGEGYKWGWMITDIVAPNSIDYIELEITSNRGLRWLNNYSFMVDDVLFDFSDILNVSYECKEEISENGTISQDCERIVNGYELERKGDNLIILGSGGLSEIWIDPTTTIGEARSLIVGDAYVSIRQPTTNYGGSPVRYVASDKSTPRRYMRSYIDIDLSSLGNIFIENLNFYEYLGGVESLHSAIDIEYYFCNDTDGFGERLITWNNQDTQVTGCEASPFYSKVMNTYTAGTWYNISANLTNAYHRYNSTRFVIKVITNPEQYDGTFRALYFRTKEYSGTTYDPYLNVIYYLFNFNISHVPEILIYQQDFNITATPDLDIDYNISWCNLTTTIPNGTKIIDNQAMTNVSNTYYYYNITTNQSYYNITITCEDTNGNQKTNFLQAETYMFNETVTYEESVLSTDETTISIVVDTSTNLLTLDYIRLHYDGVNYTTTKTHSTTSTGNRYLAEKTLTTPLVTSDTNKTFYWILGYNYGENYYTDETNQTIKAFGVTNCTGSGTKALHFYTKKESDGTALTTTSEIEFIVWPTNINYAKTITWKETSVNNFDVCLYPADHSLNANYLIQTAATGYTTRTISDNNIILTNESSNISIYLGTGTTVVTIHVSDLNDQPIQNAIVKSYLKKISDGEFIMIESGETNHEGQTTITINETDRYYKFEIFYLGESIYNSTAFKITKTDIYFRIPLDTYTTLQDYLNVLGISHALQFINTTNTFLLSFTDPNEYATSVCLKVENRSVTGYTTMSNVCSQETTDNIAYSIGPVTSGYYLATVYAIAKVDGKTYLLSTLGKDFTAGWEVFGKSGVVVGMLIIGTAAFIGLYNPAAGIILALTATALTSLLGFIHITWAGLVALGIVGVIIVIKNKT